MPIKLLSHSVFVIPSDVEEWSEWDERHGRQKPRRVAASESGDERVQSISEMSRDVSTPLDMTSRSAVDKIDNGAGLTPNTQIDRAATNGAVFDQRLLRLRGVDLQRKNFAAMRTGDFGFDDKLHCCSGVCSQITGARR